MVREEGVSSLGRDVIPNVFRAVLMNPSQLASYDFFKAELLKTKYLVIRERRHPRVDEGRRRNVHVQGVVARMDASAAVNDPHLLDARAAEEWCRLVAGEGVYLPVKV
ncbi:hypothetical protein CVT25_014182 [Psilocybe cyanescens]|uniref:Uncharacterized protein n=1 Tax=Psilocybe cyanescens TaxID=93625 RepID=A0A409X8V5_PSICY|nr:hypothetical protein CVT25_014182 [Psilocybe cyanescens]